MPPYTDVSVKSPMLNVEFSQVLFLITELAFSINFIFFLVSLLRLFEFYNFIERIWTQ